ncbi:MAG: carboxypeptidase regulatory-like domain-containing protein [Ignavibacteriales bacterium]|nr:carboxypeptidase regulatory-like domain-containing protein [Ignavibacteriales bacterium]
MKYKTKSVFILSIFLLFGCSGMAQEDSTGGIFGYVIIAQKKSNTLYTTSMAKFTIEELRTTTYADSGGYFYFDNLPEGKYTIKGEIEGFRKITILETEIKKNEITLFDMDHFVFSDYEENIEMIERWNGINVEKVPFDNLGMIEGYVIDARTEEKIKGAQVSLYIVDEDNKDITTERYILGTDTDNDGYYKFNNILVGCYYVKVGCISYERSVIMNVIVKKKMRSIVEINMEKESHGMTIIKEWEIKYK